MSSQNEVAILDFGSQYTHLIARRVRELGVVSHIYPTDVPASKLKNAVAIILSGGPRSLVRDPRLPFDPAIFNLGIPMLGLCYGHQLVADIFGGKVASGTAREYGLAALNISPSPIFERVKKKTVVWMSHGDHVEKIPSGFKQIATTGNGSVAAMADEKKKMYGFQFHPEVAHSKEGKKMLHNFLFKICKAKKNWNVGQMLSSIEQSIEQLTNCHSDRASQRAEESRTIGERDPSTALRSARDDRKNVFLLVSGGVDSTVCFALLEKVLGKKRVFGLHIDNGFMRLDETKKITKALKKIGFNNLHIYDAEKEFLQALRGVTEPEQKRKIIGNLFLDITDRIMKEKGMDGKNWLLGQGTIYPDTIESGGTKNADVIKTHHNRVPRVQQMITEGRVIEPLKELYKDEVREIGLKLGLPKELIFRHPFPGPGLAIRCLCSEGSKEKAEFMETRPPPPLSLKGEGRNASPPFEGEIQRGSRNITLLKLPIKSVGVQGDERSYAHPAVITNSKINWPHLATLSPQITNTHKDINRVLFLLSGDINHLQQSHLHKAYLTKNRLDLLRKIDAIVHDAILTDKNCKKIWQLPIVLVPFGHKHGESIVLRPVESEEAMTVSFGKIPEQILQKITKKIMALNAIDFIFYDITNKPPGTIEWE